MMGLNVFPSGGITATFINQKCLIGRISLYYVGGGTMALTPREKVRLIEKVTLNILENTSVSDKHIAYSIARRWVG